MLLKLNSKKHVVTELATNNGHNKMKWGIIIILLSPLLGSLVFSIYIHFVRFVIYSHVETAMFWFSCILIISLIGISLVLIGCSERVLKKLN